MENPSTKGTCLKCLHATQYLPILLVHPIRLLLLAVALLLEHTQSLSGLHRSQLGVVSVVLTQCWVQWSRAEEESRRKEQEEQNLYRYRERTHVIEEGEGEVLEEELRRVFPVYSDLMEDEESCDTTGESCDVTGGSHDMADGEVPVTAAGGSATVEFSAEELQCIANLHLCLYHKEGGVPMQAPPLAQSAKLSYDMAGSLARSVDAIPGREGGWFHWSLNVDTS